MVAPMTRSFSAHTTSSLNTQGPQSRMESLSRLLRSLCRVGLATVGFRCRVGAASGAKARFAPNQGPKKARVMGHSYIARLL